MKKLLIIILMTISLVSCKQDEIVPLKFTPADKKQVLLIEDFYSRESIRLIPKKTIEFKKSKDYEDDCIRYNYSVDFLSDKNVIRGAIESDTYEYLSTSKEGIHKFFQDSINRNYSFDHFNFTVINYIEIKSADKYCIHEVRSKKKFMGYFFNFVKGNKIFRSLILSVSASRIEIKKIEEKLIKVQETAPNSKLAKSPKF